MFQYLHNLFKWNKRLEVTENQKSFLGAAFISLLEDILFWKKIWLSITFLIIVHVILLVCMYRNISLFGFLLKICIISLVIDAFETWLKYKHRTAFLKRLVNGNGDQIKSTVWDVIAYSRKKWIALINLREVNPTKAFLLANITLWLIFFIGKYVNGFMILYITCMVLCLSKKINTPIAKVLKKIQINNESDIEFEGLIPEVSERDIQFLSVEQEQLIDEKQSFDYWKPDDIPLEDDSDSSDQSSSLVTNLSIEKLQKFDKNVDVSDSSEDEYIPSDQEGERLQTTLEVQHSNSWSNSAFNTISYLSGNIINYMYAKKEEPKEGQISSSDLSDGFEIIDRKDIM